jgi:hypothetical protein
VFTKKRRQLSRGQVLMMALGALSIMFRDLLPQPVLAVVFLAIVGMYFIWTRL